MLDLIWLVALTLLKGVGYALLLYLIYWRVIDQLHAYWFYSR